jgi:hypothetical protein
MTCTPDDDILLAFLLVHGPQEPLSQSFAHHDGVAWLRRFLGGLPTWLPACSLNLLAGETCCARPAWLLARLPRCCHRAPALRADGQLSLTRAHVIHGRYQRGRWVRCAAVHCTSFCDQCWWLHGSENGNVWALVGL